MILKSQHDTPNFIADGLSVTAVEPWFKVKVEVIQSYLQAFVLNVSPKADEIVFIDLFSGSGLYSIGYQKEIFPSSSFAALSADLPITQWVFCERDPEALKLLHKRTDQFFKRKNIHILDEPLSELTDKFRRLITAPKRDHTVAVLCLVDPFAFDIPFATINSFASLGFSFLMPFTFMLNDRTNYHYYLKEHPDRLKRYLGVNNFEKLSGVHTNVQFYKRIVRMYQNSMLVMGLNTALSVHKVNSRLMEIPAYHIGLFSKKFSAREIQKELNMSGQLEIDLFE